MTTPIRLSDEHDWPEDFAHENGRYVCRCADCQATFIGHKRRVQCRKCYHNPEFASRPIVLCWRCKGAGSYETSTCPKCKGTGRLDKDGCPYPSQTCGTISLGSSFNQVIANYGHRGQLALQAPSLRIGAVQSTLMVSPPWVAACEFMLGAQACDLSLLHSAAVWVRYTGFDGIYRWLHSMDNRWVEEPEQIDMSLFDNSVSAMAALNLSPMPPEWAGYREKTRVRGLDSFSAFANKLTAG